MILTYKYRLYPTTAQAEWLEGQLREACELYNAALQERRDAWKVCRKHISFYDQDRQLRPMRADGCLKIPNFHCARAVLLRVDKSFQAFFRRVKRGEKAGYPRFRSSRRYDSLTFPTYGDGCKLRGRNLYLQGGGEIKVRLHRPVGGTIKTVTVKREAGRWFAGFAVEQVPVPLETNDSAVGIDVGLTTFATLSDGTEIANPEHYRAAQAKLRKCQRRLARRKRGSNRRRKALLLLQRAHVHVRNQRNDYHHQASRWIVNRYGTIAVEDLNVKGLAASRLAKSVNDAGWSDFLSKLAYKAANAGRQFVRVDSRGTSQTCTCGARVEKKLWNRWHSCPECGLSAGRDHVSAQVILQRAGNQPSGANVGELIPCVA